MAWGAVRGGSRPAAIAAVVLAAIALFVALVIDLPDLNETGLIGRTYDQAEARPQVGFFVETLGATLALLGAIGTLVLSGTLRTSLPRTWPPSMRSCASAARSSGKTSSCTGAAGRSSTSSASSRRSTPLGRTNR